MSYNQNPRMPQRRNVRRYVKSRTYYVPNVGQVRQQFSGHQVMANNQQQQTVNYYDVHINNQLAQRVNLNNHVIEYQDRRYEQFLRNCKPPSNAIQNDPNWNRNPN